MKLKRLAIGLSVLVVLALPAAQTARAETKPGETDIEDCQKESSVTVKPDLEPVQATVTPEAKSEKAAEAK